MGYIDGQGVWHNQGDDCFKFNVTVKKRSFTVVQPAAKSVGDDCFWIPQIKDNETGKIIDLMSDAPSGSFYPFEYYRDGVKLNASQYWHNPDDFKQPGNYTVKIKPDKGWIYDLGDQSEIVIPIPTQKPDDETFEITGPDTVEQFKNIILKTNADTDVTWTSSDPSIATIDANGKVTGVAEGKVTITATAIAADGKVLTATHDVTVTKSTAQTNSAKLFFLKSPTSNPDSNSVRDWFPTGGSSNLNVKVNVDGAAFSGKNTWDNVANRVLSWPDGSTGTTWTLPRANSYWSQVFNNYKNEIQNKLHVSITEDDVEAIVLHPYKISKNSGVYHLDCKVEIKVKQVVTATFWIQSPGATGFDEQYSVSTLEVKDGVAQVVAPEAPEAEKTVDGTKYKFMGWYSDEACTQAVTFPITTSENVFYYGKYVPCDQSIQVNYYLEGTTKPVAPSKTLTGYMKGQTVTQEPIAIPGYTPVSGEAKMGVVGTDASIDFFYTANTVNYKVEYYWNGSSEPFETDNAYGKCGDTISDITPKSFSGYTAVSNGAKSLTLSGDENKNVVKFYYYKNVALTANSDTKTYNGSEQSVDGYTTNLREGTIASFDGVALNGGKGTNAGDYAYTFADGTMGKVSTDNNYIVTELNPGNLHISPVKNEVTITIAGHKGGEKYNGDEQTVEGYDVSDLPSGVSKDDIASNGSAEVKAADAGTYPMNLNEKQFSLTGDAAKNYTNVKFVVTDGELKIDKRAVTLTSEDGHKNYDGKTLQRRTNLKVGGDGFVGNDGVLAKDKLTWYDENNILPGTYENKFEPAYTEGTNLDNYEVTLKFGELVVNARSDKDKYQITVTAKSDTKPYNGNVYTVSGVADTTFTNDKGATFTVEGLSASVSATDAGEYDNKVVGTAVVKDAQGNDVTSQFNVTTVDGKLIINKRNVVLVSESHGFTYDGLDHDWQKVNVDPNSDGFVNGESVAYKDFASIKDVGTKDNSFDFDWSNAKEQNYNITKRYGSLAVSAGDINKYVTLNTTDVEETYNGEHHIAGEATAIDQNGNSLVVEYQKSDGNWTTDRNEVYAVNVGEYGIVNVRVSSPANYGEGSYVTGTERLVVKPIDIELTAKSDNQPYSGTALTNNGYDITNGAFVGDEGLDSVTVSGSQLEVGSSSNVIDAYRLKGNTKAENYNITPKPGTLEVTASHAVVVVKIEGNKDSQKYSGVEQSVSGYKVTGVTVDGQESTLYPAAETDFTFSGAATAARTDAGTTQMGLSAEQFKNANKNFSNVTFEVEDGSMTVTKRAVTLTSATDKKTYDGDALTNDTVTVSGDGFVDGQGFTANVTGSQTNAGSSDNTFTYELTGGAAEGENGNYTIAKSEGKLTVDPITAPVTITIAGKTATGTYNGKELTAEGYTFASDNTYYTQDKVAFSGDSKVARTDAGKTEMGLPGKFANADTTNFTNVTFVVTDGHVDIAKADVTLKSADLTKPYDGTALTNKNGGETETPLATESGFAEGEGATYSFSGSQTVVGSSANAFNYTLNEGTKAENYNITVTPGTLTVTNRDAKYQITVKANSDTATYDGKQHSATGIETNEFTTVEGNTYTVSGLTTENPVKTNAGTYPNNITGTAVVTDANGNDVSDQFEVTTKNGSLVIDRAAVTMKSASDEWTYDGNEHAKQDMEFVNGFAEGEGATFAYTGAITNVGEAENTYTYTLNANTSADNYTFAEPEYGTLKVNPVTDKVTVTIKGKQDTKSYNGSTQFVTGYDFSTNNSLYAQTNVKFTGDATAKGIAVGSYNMNLAKEQFSNTNENFSNVEFVVEDGWLKIDGGEIDQNGVSWNTHDNQKVYEGTPLAAYAATATDKHGNALNVEYSIDGKTWTSDPSQITITHFGYQVVQLRATGSNYAEGQYATSFEGIAITKRLVTLTSEGGNKPYDGTPLTNGTVTATAKGKGVGFIDGEGVSFNVTGSQTEKGESDNTFDYTFNEGTSAADYWVTPKYGKLIVTADENEVVVTIAENGGNVEYDGTEKSVSGYKFSASNELYKKSDFIFSGNDTVKGTNVGTYDMELKPSDFTNNNQNFSKVTFVVVDGRLNITPKDIKTGENMTVEAPANVTYNGQPQQEEPVVKDGDKTLAKNVDYTLSYSKDTTNVGTVTVTVTGKGNYSGSADVEYQILKRSVVLESATDSKPYDGTALTRPNVTVTGDGFVEGEVTNVRATGSVTTVAEGEVVNTIVYDEGVNFKAGNYDITKKEGKLSITALSAEDGLVITPNNVEYTYNAESHSAGLASASASVAGVNVSLEYRVKGSPDAEWRSNVSEITAINAGTVTIEVRASADNYSGYKYAEQTLTINKRDVELTSASATKVYDGTALTKDWVDMGPNRADTGFIWTDLADDGQVHATGSQTVVGKSENTISYKLKAGAASNYNIIGEHLGTLEVTEQSIVSDPKNPESYTGVTMSNPSDSVYNGEEHKWTPEVKDAKGNVLVEGADYTVSYDTDNFTDAKTIKVTITGTGNYTGVATKTYKITPAPLKVIADSASKPYDGKPLTAGGVIEGLVDGETATAQTEGSQTEVGSSVNTAKESIEWGAATNKDNYYIQSLTDGKLTVTAKSIMPTDDNGMSVSSPSDVTYNGADQTWTPVVKDGDKELSADDYTVSYSTEDRTNVTGVITVTIMGKGNYTGAIEKNYQVLPKGYSVTTATGSKVYDGKPLKGAELEGNAVDGLVDSSDATFAVTGSQTEVGGDAKNNTYELTFSSEQMAKNYTLASEQLGTLTVTENADEIVVTTTGGEFTYDGQAHGATVSVSGLPEGYTLERAESSAMATDVTTDDVIADADTLVIKNAQGEDVTNKLNIKKIPGAIKVTPATLTVTTYGAKAEYNGNALTADGTIEGFVNNETATFATTGSQTYVGESDNTYSIAWDGTAKESNYTVAPIIGKLKVTDDIDNSKVINKGHESGTYDLGATVNFAITAKNVYDTPQTMTISEIEGVTLDQSVFKNVAPGASIEAHATYTITEADLLAGTFVNTATVTFGNGKSYKNTDEVDVAKLNAHLSVVKATTSTPANGSAYQLGETIEYAVTVTNDGNLTANNVAVSDELAGVQLAEGQNANVGTLAPGASATVNYVYTVTEADVLAGNVRNNATATGTPNGGGTLDVTPGTTTDPTGPAAGHITVVKTTTSTPENGKAYQLGEKIVYSIHVVNDGNLTASNVKVSDANADNFGEKVIESLAPGASEDFEATHTVTEADVLAGTVTNVATAKGTSPDPNAPEVPVTPGTKDEPTDTPNAHITIVKHAEQNGSGEAGAFKLGETIEYAITVTNTGNLTATGVKVSDANADNFGEKTIESLAPGASETFTASHTVTEADVLAGKVNNVATAKGTSPDPIAPEVPVTPGEDTKIVDPVNTTLTVAKQAAAPANGEAYQLGEEVVYTISVTNSGNVAYSNVKVSDAQTGLNEVIGTLAVGETKTYEAKHVITEQDIVAGVYVNTATAKADPIFDGNGASHTPQGEATETIGANTDKPLVPGSANLAVEKVVTNEGTGESGAFKLGDTIEYKITVTNNGTLTAKGFKVIDNNADGFEPVTIDELAPGATTDAISAKHVVTSDDILAGSVFNVATTAGGTTPDPKVDPEPTPGENDQPVDAVNATLNVEKTAAASASGSYKLGEGVVYTIKVTNNGNVPYENVKVADGQTGLNETIDMLAVGETRTFTTTHVVDEADIIAGSYTNVATATADPIHDPKTGADVTPQGSDDETIGANTDRPIEPSNPALRITKTSDVAAGTLLKEGDAVTYTVTVENTGNLTLTNVKAADNLAGATLAPGQSDTRAELAPGEQFSVNYVYEVTQADVVAGSVHNEATASGVSPDPNKPVDPGAPGTKDDPTETAKPSLSIQKSNNGSADVAAGSTVSYTITATNNGNVDLTGVVVTDELTGSRAMRSIWPRANRGPSTLPTPCRNLTS
ncbi:MAG: Ig-like domain-containing protein [Slackia sp.]|nr:Ig-like domain-containing protein [Slackia sp.]